MNPASRKVHRLLAPWLALPLVLTLLTGVIYRLGRAWFHIDKETAEEILHIHTGEWINDAAALPYVFIVGLGLLALVVTGSCLLWKSGLKKGPRFFHRAVGAALLLPLSISAGTGVLFMASEKWFHWTHDTQEFLLKLHEGGWLGRSGRVYYVLAIGLGLLFLIWSGLQMILNRSRQAA